SDLGWHHWFAGGQNFGGGLERGLRELVDWWRAGVSLARIRISTEILFRQPSEMRAQQRPRGLGADRGRGRTYQFSVSASEVPSFAAGRPIPSRCQSLDRKSTRLNSSH